MDLYLGGTQVVSVIQLIDNLGNPVAPDSLEYDVVDQAGTVVIARAAVSGFTPGATSVSVTVPPSANLLQPLNQRESRRITLYCSVAGNVVQIRTLYAIEGQDVLVTGINSFQTYDEAELTALDMANINSWNSASYREKLAAMIEARLRICKLNFNLLNAQFWQMDSMNYVPEGTFITPYAGVFTFTGDISFIPPESFKNLPPRFLQALAKAQIAEANAIMSAGDGSITDKRAQGLLSDAVGESKQTFSKGTPLDMGVDKVTARYLSTFITYNLRTARS